MHTDTVGWPIRIVGLARSCVVAGIVLFVVVFAGCTSAPTRHYRTGNERLYAGKFDAAVRSYTAALEEDPDLAQAHEKRGLARFMQGDSEGAVEDYTRALEVEPKFARVHNNRGFVHLKAGRTEAAIDDFTRAIELRPDYAQALNNRAAAHLVLGERQRAHSDFERSYRARPTFAAAMYFGNRAAARGEDETALRRYSEALELNPSSAAAHRARSEIHRKLGNPEDSWQDFQRYLELNPEAERRMQRHLTGAGIE